MCQPAVSSLGVPLPFTTMPSPPHTYHPTVKPALLLEAAIDAYNEMKKEEGKVPPQVVKLILYICDCCEGCAERERERGGSIVCVSRVEMG